MALLNAETVDLLNNNVLDEISRKGQEWYTTLKTELEAHYVGKTVAIHLDTGDYVIGENSPDAMRLLRHQHPTGLMVTTLIGPDQMDQFAYRLLGDTWQAKAQK